MLYRFTVTYSGFLGPEAEAKFLASMRKTLQCGALLRSVASGFDLRNYLRDISYELKTDKKLSEDKIRMAARQAGEHAFDCSAIRLTFTLAEKAAVKKASTKLPSVKSKSNKHAPAKKRTATKKVKPMTRKTTDGKKRKK